MQNKLFIDTAFVAALINKKDQYHKQALVLSKKYENVLMVSTDVVLFEIGNALAKNYKKEAVKIIQIFCSSDEITVVKLNPALFKKAFDIYKRYDDKGWGMVDCLSFVVMRENNITDVLTCDKHFEQAGFNALMSGGSV